MVSEPLRPQPERKVLEWLDARDEASLFLSVITIGELHKGIARLPEGKKRNALRNWLDEDMSRRFYGRILPIGPEVAAAGKRHVTIQARLAELMGAGDILCLPTSPRAAPLKNTSVDDIEVRYRHPAMHLLCITGLGGLAQISLPLAEIDGLPLGLSLVGPRGSDLQLLGLARMLMP